MQILKIRTELKAFERDAMHSNANSNHSKGSRSIQMQIHSIRKAFERKFEPFEKDLKHLNANFNHLRDLHHSNANLKYSKGIRSIRM